MKTKISLQSMICFPKTVKNDCFEIKIFEIFITHFSYLLAERHTRLAEKKRQIQGRRPFQPDICFFGRFF